jgi:phosphoglycerate dehydrogenase-like enzyme
VEPIQVLVTARVTPGVMEAIRSVSPRVSVITGPQLREQPDLIETVEVAYGGVGREQFSRARRLRWIQTGGAGVNGLLSDEVRRSPVVITNARIHAYPLTEQIFGLLLMLTRQLHRVVLQQQERRWDGDPMRERLGLLAGGTMLILGPGRIGERTAAVARAFGMKVIGLRRRPEPLPYLDETLQEADRDAALRRADVIVNILPLTPATRHYLGAAQFALMKPKALFINAGRGGTVDTEALVAALREHRIGGAGLDVTDPEPLPPDYPLWAMENVIVAPHYGGSRPRYEEHAGQVFVENLRRYVAGAPLLNVIDKEAGY